MATNVKLGVDTSGFKAGIQDANAQLKSFDAQLKYAETAMKNAGNAEAGMTTKMNALNGKLNTQKQLIQQYEQRLKQLRENGVDPLSAEYQKLNAALLNTRTGMLETEAALNGLGDSTAEAAAGADKLAQSMNGIGRKISLEQVISGINTITGGLEKAASKAVDLGKAVWTNVMDSARWADDTATMAMMYGIDLDTYQRMQKLVTNGLDTSVDAILSAQTKLRRGVGEGAGATMDTLRELGMLISVGKHGEEMLVTEDSVELFWEAGRALMAMGDAAKQEAAAQALFGRSWRDLVPLFDTEHGGFANYEDYKAALAEVNVLSEDDVNALAELNDKVGELKGNFETLSQEVWAAMAPALTEAAQALNGVLQSVLEYVQKPEGKEMLERLGEAVSGLFEDLGKIDPEKVVENFASLFEGVVNSFKWLEEHWGDVKNALIGIAAGFGVLKISSMALNIAKTVQGLGDLLNKGGTPTTTTTGGGGGWFGGGGSEMGIVSKAGALGLTGLTMLAPALLTKILSDMVPEENKLFSTERVRAATYSQEEVERLREWVELQNELVRLENEPGVDIFTDARYGETLDKIAGMNVQQGDLWSRYWDYLVSNDKRPGIDILPTEILDQMAAEGIEAPILIDPVVPDDAAAQISEGIGAVPVPVDLVFRDLGESELAELLGGSHANGIWSVPRDNYLAYLHKGERVVPAREVSSRNYSSNLYVESMYMNNGQDAEGLAAAMAAAQRRTQAGFGS